MYTERTDSNMPFITILRLPWLNRPRRTTRGRGWGCTGRCGRGGNILIIPYTVSVTEPQSRAVVVDIRVILEELCDCEGELIQNVGASPTVELSHGQVLGAVGSGVFLVHRVLSTLLSTFLQHSFL